ncbi:MAG: M81 family metallopeptidase [Planctomycetota bacterium]|nr:M81 family metallopeptidase [Planctomycetota bacterium]
MSYRIAVGGFFTECNCFGGVPIDLDRFRQQEYLLGTEILGLRSGVVGGMLDLLDMNDDQIVPLLFTSSCPGGPMTSECYAAIKDELIERLSAVLPVDGILLPLHGSATVEDVHDPEGDLIRTIRKMAGPDIPVIATLDLHAHVTEAMVRYSDALVAWETYPHADAYTTGERGARLMHDILSKGLRPTMAMAKVPVITSGIHGSTEGDDPFADLMRQTKEFENQKGVLTTSLFMVHPYNDLPDMGSGCLVVTDNDEERAIAIASEVAAAYWERRFDLEPQTLTADDAVAAGLKVDGGPVVLVETSDCCGGGAAGDSVATLKALLKTRPNGPAYVPVVDPEAAALCTTAGVGKAVTLSLGHKLDSAWGEPVEVTGEVIRVSDGTFTYSGGIFEGSQGEMGQTAVLQVDSIYILIASLASYDWKDEQFRSVGLDPLNAKFIIAKNPMNYRYAYGNFAKAIYILNTPGPTPATLRHVEFRRLQRPYFPRDEDIPGGGLWVIT